MTSNFAIGNTAAVPPTSDVAPSGDIAGVLNPTALNGGMPIYGDGQLMAAGLGRPNPATPAAMMMNWREILKKPVAPGAAKPAGFGKAPVIPAPTQNKNTSVPALFNKGGKTWKVPGVPEFKGQIKGELMVGLDRALTPQRVQAFQSLSEGQQITARTLLGAALEAMSLPAGSAGRIDPKHMGMVVETALKYAQQTPTALDTAAKPQVRTPTTQPVPPAQTTRPPTTRPVPPAQITRTPTTQPVPPAQTARTSSWSAEVNRQLSTIPALRQAIDASNSPAAIKRSNAAINKMRDGGVITNSTPRPAGSGASATPGSAADQARAFVESLDTKQRKAWEMQLVGGPSLQEVVAGEARQGALTAGKVESAVARARPAPPPPLPSPRWVKREAFYEVRYDGRRNFNRKLEAALNKQPWELPMQIRTPDGSRRLDIYRGGPNRSVMIMNPRGSGTFLDQPTGRLDAIAEALGIGDGSYGAIVVSYGSSEQVISDNAQPYRRAGTPPASATPSLSRLPLRELQEADRRHPANPASLREQSADLVAWWKASAVRASPANVKRFKQLQANANNGGLLTSRQLYVIGKLQDPVAREDLIALAAQGFEITERDFNKQLRNPAATLLPNRTSYQGFVAQMLRSPTGRYLGGGHGLHHKAGALDLIGSIERDLNTSSDAAAVNRALLSIDEKLIKLTLGGLSVEDPKHKDQAVAMLWRFRGLVTRLHPSSP